MTKRSGAQRKKNGRKQQTKNMYTNLPSIGDDGEMNEHLNERFANVPVRHHQSPAGDNFPVEGPTRVNNDIREYFVLTNKPVTGGSWLEKPEIPASAEILPLNKATSKTNDDDSLVEVNEPLRPHKVQGAYEDKDEYLGTTYELLREDLIRPLREAVQVVRESPYKDEAEYDDNGLGVYDPVYIKSLVFSMRGLATRVAFSMSRVKKQVRWEQSKRLITGTLVALTPTNDAFQNICILATVAARPLAALGQNPPEIDLFFARPHEQEIDPVKKWMMVECRSSFFEASRHTMLALQHMMREPFPMSEHLVGAQSTVDTPAYIQSNPQMSLSSLVTIEESQKFDNVDVLEDWPSKSALPLDRSQSEALRRILTKKLAIVQGPPGTGKTYVSVLAIKAQCENLRRGDAPIIITAQTNHAVDQILRHTMEFEPSFIRLGGRSKDPEVKKRTLYEIRRGIPPSRCAGSLKAEATKAIKRLTAECQRLLAPLEANMPPLDHKTLLKYELITREQSDSLELDSQCTMGMSPAENPSILMEQWLGKCIVSCTRPIQPEDYEWDFEEEDFEVEQLQELEAEAATKDDDDFENLGGEEILISDNYTGKGLSTLTSVKQVQEVLRMTDDLATILPQDRGAIYNYFKRELKKAIAKKIRSIAVEYSRAMLQRKIGQWEEDSRLLSQARIIGCTTTGLSKYRALIASLRPRVILVEEAAETLEAPMTAACMPSLEHLILVGDHLQLRPHTQVHDFEDEPYYLNMSLFERLVQNNVEYTTLTRQRRMIPEVRRLLTPIYGRVLKDHESVEDAKNRPPVQGMGGINSYFFCHDAHEACDHNMSSFNEYEAQMIVGLVDYLVLNGVEPSKITLLTFYNGQRKRLVKLLRDHQNLRVHPLIKVVTVDGYQGEENDVVILSLVRSNKRGAIGFLSNENRACVALSRAKRGFYIFGNGEMMACESGVWAEVIEIMHGASKDKVIVNPKRRIGYYLPLQCEKHDRRIFMQEPEDWSFTQGGCDLRCGGQVPCGHKCPYHCHPFPHDQVNCMQKCDRVLPCGHTCVAICCDPCKCQSCDRRANGMKTLLKATQIQISPARAFTPHSMSTPKTNAIQPASPATQGWTRYINGGAAADDAAVRDNLRAQEAELLLKLSQDTGLPTEVPSHAQASLIDISDCSGPVQPSLSDGSSKQTLSSGKSDLLIDLGRNLEEARRTEKRNDNAPVKGKGKGKGKAAYVYNLLD